MRRRRTLKKIIILAFGASLFLFWSAPALAVFLQVSATVQSSGGVEISWTDPAALGTVYYRVTGTDGFSQSGFPSPLTDPNGQAGTQYTISEIDNVDGSTLASQTATASSSSPPVGSSGAGQAAAKMGDIWDIFPSATWAIAMEWYETLSLFSGAFIFLAFLRTGFQYMRASDSPGVRADFFAQLNRILVAAGIIVLMPFIVHDLLIPVNDGFVQYFANILNHYQNVASLQEQQAVNIGVTAGPFVSILTWPITALAALIEKLFGLRGIDTLIFNHQLTVNIFGNFSLATITTDPFSNAIIHLVLVGFQLFFNGLFTIRKWVVTACFVATPLLIWVWVITEEVQVLEILVGEIVSSIFMQSAYALSFAVFFSILAGPGVPAAGSMPNTAGAVRGVGTAALAGGLVRIGTWVAGFAGAVGLVMLVILALQVIAAQDEKALAAALGRIKKVLLGLAIVGLSLLLAGFVAYLVNGVW